MKRRWLMLTIVFCVLLMSMTTGYCEVWYSPAFFGSDKEALDVLQSLKGSFWGWSNYPKQTVEIDKYGLRLFSEYIGTKKVWNTWEMYYMTVPDLRSEKAALVFKDVFLLRIDRINVASAANQWAVTIDYTPATTFCVADELTARRFADAVATLAAASGARWMLSGGYILPTSEDWFRDKLKWKKNTGAPLKAIVTGGPFDRAGIQNEDILLTFGGQEIADGAMLRKIELGLAALPSEEIRIAVTVFRQGTILNKEVAYPNPNVKTGAIRKLIDQPVAPVAPPVEKPKLGATIRPLTEDDVKKLNLDSANGVLVTGIDTNSTAQRMNLQVNDVILEINGLAVKNSDQLREIMAAASVINKLKVKRGETVVELVVPVSI